MNDSTDFPPISYGQGGRQYQQLNRSLIGFVYCAYAELIEFNNKKLPGQPNLPTSPLKKTGSRHNVQTAEKCYNKVMCCAYAFEGMSIRIRSSICKCVLIVTQLISVLCAH